MRSQVRGSQQYEAVADHLRRVHEPAFGRPHALGELDASHDGSQVVVTGRVFDELDGVPRSALYLCRDGQLRTVTTVGGSARGARFAPDGRTLAFLSDRATPGVFQLHLLRPERLGEALAAPSVPGTVEYAHWSPDGRRVLLGVADLGADRSGAQGSGTLPAEPDEPIDRWQPRVETTGSAAAGRALWIYDVSSETVSRVSPDGLNCWEAGWCGPDRVAAVASDGPEEDDWYGAGLTVIDIRDGAARTLLSSSVQLGLPAGSPDGRWVAVVRAVCSDRGVVAGDLVLVELDTGRCDPIDTNGTDVACLQWIDATRLGFLGQRHLDSIGGVVDIDTRSVDDVLRTGRSCSGSGHYPAGVFTDDGAVITIQDAYDVPPQVVRSRPGNDDAVLASAAHPGTDYLTSVAGTAEPIDWTAPDGLSIEGILCTPAGDGPHPLVVTIHGGPVSAFRNCWSMGKDWVPLLVAHGYAVLCPNPRGSGGRGQEFAARVVGDMGGADTHDHLSGVDALVARGVADPDRLGLIGGSYGGFMSSWLVTQDRRFAAAVPISPVTDWYSQAFTSNIAGWGNAFLKADPEQPGSRAHTRSPVLLASNVDTPCLVVAGARDRCTPPGQAREFYEALRSKGTEAALVIYPEEGHGVRSYPAIIDLLTRVVGWFDGHMALVPSPEED